MGTKRADSRVPTDRPVLIVNADDFGFTDGVNRGIIEAHLAGTVTSASLMVNTPGFAGAVEALRRTPTLRVGLHANFTAGKPLSAAPAVPSLVEPETGQLLPLRRLVWRAMSRGLVYREVYREVEAQFGRALDEGIVLTHVDGHQHVHQLPVIADAVRDVASRFGVHRIRAPFESLGHRPWRLRATMVKVALRLADRGNLHAHCTSLQRVHVRGISLQGGGPFAQRLRRELQTLPQGVTELIVHPGYVDATLASMDDYLAPREIERAALTSEPITALLRALPIRLATFATL